MQSKERSLKYTKSLRTSKKSHSIFNITSSEVVLIILYWSVRAPSNCLLCPLCDRSPSFFEHFFLAHDVTSSYFPYSSPRISHFSKDPWFLLVENGIQKPYCHCCLSNRENLNNGFRFPHFFLSYIPAGFLSQSNSFQKKILLFDLYRFLGSYYL